MVEQGTHGYVPHGWPDAVSPPGSEDWEASAAAWLPDLVPDLRGHTMVRRHPVILAAIARHVAAGAAEGARAGYRTARTELGAVVPPHAVDAALTAYRDEGRRLVAAARGAELIERASRRRSLTDGPEPARPAGAAVRSPTSRAGHTQGTHVS
jgi:hypothetical protein